jgi:hypothetical protein
MKPLSNDSMFGLNLACAYLGTVLPVTAITVDGPADGAAYLYAFIGNDGPAVSAQWESGSYSWGRVGKRPFTTQQGFVNAVMRATARP